MSNPKNTFQIGLNGPRIETTEDKKINFVVGEEKEIALPDKEGTIALLDDLEGLSGDLLFEEWNGEKIEIELEVE